jgi:hypothetical protein
MSELRTPREALVHEVRRGVRRGDQGDPRPDRMPEPDRTAGLLSRPCPGRAAGLDRGYPRASGGDRVTELWDQCGTAGKSLVTPSGRIASVHGNGRCWARTSDLRLVEAETRGQGLTGKVSKSR